MLHHFCHCHDFFTIFKPFLISKTLLFLNFSAQTNQFQSYRTQWQYSSLHLATLSRFMRFHAVLDPQQTSVTRGWFVFLVLARARVFSKSHSKFFSSLEIELAHYYFKRLQWWQLSSRWKLKTSIHFLKGSLFPM